MTWKVLKKDEPKKKNKRQNQSNRKYPVDTLLPISNTYGDIVQPKSIPQSPLSIMPLHQGLFLKGFADTFINVKCYAQ